MSRWMTLKLFIMLPIWFFAAGLFLGKDIWEPKPLFSSTTLTFQILKAPECRSIQMALPTTGLYRGVEFSCDGQTTVWGPRDEAAQAFWDKVIELTPRRYLEPPHPIKELKR